MIKKVYHPSVIILLLAIIFKTDGLNAQCISSSNIGTVTASSMFQTMVNTMMYQNQFAVVNFTAAGEYQADASFGTAFAMTDNNNSVIASGGNPLFFTITTPGLYRIHVQPFGCSGNSFGDRIVAINNRNRAFNFDGTNDVINIGTAITNSLGTSSVLTAEAWVRPTTTTSVGSIVSNHNTNTSFCLRRNNNYYEAFLGFGTYGVTTAAGTATTNVWQHVAMVFEGSSLKIYINGQLSNTTTFSPYTLPISSIGNASVQIGNNGFNELFTGDIDEVRIWKRALCQSEIQNNYIGGIPTTANALIANYHFDQGIAGGANSTVTTLTDYSGNNYNGTVTNAALSGGTSNWVGSTTFLAGYFVNPFVPPSITISGVNSVCSGSTATLTASGVNSYTWTSGPVSPTFAVSPTTTTTYSVIGTATNGCQSNITTKQVTVNPLPTITVNSGSICSGSSFNMVPSGASTYTFQGGSSLVSPSSNTSYTVTGTSALGCVSQSFATSNVTVFATPTIAVNSGTICSGTSFTISPSGANTYTVQGGSTIVTPGGNANYTVVGTSTAGCVSAVSATSSIIVNTTPTVTINSGSICSGNNFTLSPGGASTYTIQGGATVVSPGSNTTYTVRGTSTQGCISANTATSSVNVNITPTVSANSGSICSGTSFTILPSGANNYTIQGGNNVVSPTSNAVYTITGSSSAGCLSANTASSNVNVFLTPTVAVNSGSICSGNSFTIVPSGANTYTIQGGINVVSPTSSSNYSVSGTSTAGCVSGNNAVSTVSVYARPTISVNNGTICNGTSFTMVPSGANTYTIQGGNNVVSPTANTSYTIIGTSTAGCVGLNTATSNVTVNQNPTISVNSGSICNGTSFTLVPSGAGTYTIEGGNNVVTPTVNTSYTVVGTSTSGCIGANTATASVTVYANPTIGVNNGTICSGNSFTIVPSGASTYSIEGGSSVVSPTLNTTYTVTGISTEGCAGVNTATSIVNVNTLPTVSAASSSTNFICVGENATLTVNGAVNYTWSLGGNSTSVSVSPTVTTTYTVTGTDANGCMNTASVTQSVNACTGINTLNTLASLIQMYPNPTQDVVTINFGGIQLMNVTVKVFNSLGQLVISGAAINDSHQLNLIDFAQGIYVVKVFNGNQEIVSQKLIKQ